MYNLDAQQIASNKKRVGNALGASSVGHDQTRDPSIAVEAMFSQLKSGFGLLAEPAVAKAAEGLAAVAAGIAKINAVAAEMPETMKVASGVAAGAVALGVTAVGAKMSSATLGAFGVNTTKGIGKGLLTAGRLGRGGLAAGGLGLGAATMGGFDMMDQADKTIAAARRVTRGKGTADEFAAVEETSAALRKSLFNFLMKPFSGLSEQWGGAKPQAVLGPGGNTGPAPGAPDAIKQASTAIDAAGAAASGAAPNLTTTASGITDVKNAAAGAGGALSSLAGQIRALGNVGVPSAAPAGGGTAPGAAPAVPGRSGSFVPPARSSAPIQVATTLNVDGRRTAQNVTRHIVAANDTRNGTQSFDSNRLKTPVGYSSPTQA